MAIKFSPKSLEVIAKYKRARITLLEGVVRSSKSYTADYIVVKKILPSLPPCNVLISGYSSDSARGNIIAEWEKKFNREFKEHRDTKGTYLTISVKGLHNKRFYIRGGGKAGDEKAIKGITFGLWYGDEITEQTQEFVQQALTRMSSAWSTTIWTTNPGGPVNFIKVNYIDREAEKKGLFQSFKFRIYDNPSLPAAYIRSLQSDFQGVFYKRNILGLWVAAEGSIYTMLNDDNLTDYIPKNPERIYIGIDYGTSNFTAFLKIYKEKGIYYVVDEYGYSGQESEEVKTPNDYVDDLKIFLGKDTASITAIYTDPSANFFIATAKKAGITKFRAVDNEVIPGIQLVSNMFAANIIKYHRTRAKESFKESQGYLWDKRAQEKGEDKPLKKDDHYSDALRYIMKSLGIRRVTKTSTAGAPRTAVALANQYANEKKNQPLGKMIANKISEG